MSKISGIYTIICLKNGKFYVGSSIDILKRKNQHIKRLRTKSHINPKLQAAFNKYGEENFIFFLVERCVTDELSKIEQEYLDEIKPTSDDVFNLSLTSGGGKITQFSPNKGKKFSLEYRTKLSISHLGKKLSNESILKRSSKRKIPIKQIHSKTNEIIKIWPSAKEATEFFGKGTSGSITNVCLKKIKPNGSITKSAYGFRWEYV